MDAGEVDWDALIVKALNRRKNILDQKDTDCARLFHGYAEGCAGLVIEKFGRLLIIDHKIALDKSVEKLAEVLDRHIDVDTIISKGHQSLGQSLKKRYIILKGKLPEAPSFCKEAGVKYDIRPATPHNLGLYLDTREARSWLRKNSEGKRVLNLFAFTGSLGLSAQIGGAKEVVHLDKSADLVSRMKANYALNNLAWDNRCFVKGDIYKHLPRAGRSGQKFEGIILDPPPKVYSSAYAATKPKGQDFGQLVELSSQLLAPKGWLICFFHRFDKPRAEFESEVLQSSAVPLKVETRLTSGIDFPEESMEDKLRVSVFRVEDG
mgnify:CR=1 FL=1